MEIVIYRKKTRMILSFLLVVNLLFGILGQRQILICITMAIALLAVMLVVGKVKKY